MRRILGLFPCPPRSICSFIVCSKGKIICILTIPDFKSRSRFPGLEIVIATCTHVQSSWICRCVTAWETLAFGKGGGTTIADRNLSLSETLILIFSMNESLLCGHKDVAQRQFTIRQLDSPFLAPGRCYGTTRATVERHLFLPARAAEVAGLRFVSQLLVGERTTSGSQLYGAAIRQFLSVM